MPLKVAIVFTLGCSVLVVNSVLSFLPFIGLQFDLPSRILFVEGALSVMSCSIFLVGSIFSFFETLKMNTQPLEYFGRGWSIVDGGIFDEEGGGKGKHMPVMPEAPYMHQDNAHETLFNHSREASPVRSNEPEKRSIGPSRDKTWKCLQAGTLRHTYFELGIVASGLFLACSAVYCSTAIASLVTILLYGNIARSIRYPQLFAAAGFAVASSMLMIKVQRDQKKAWWHPAIHSLGWHIDLWNLIGSAGFFACAYFGLLENGYWVQFQFGCSYLWGSWAMLLGSSIQWYRAVRKNGAIGKG